MLAKKAVKPVARRSPGALGGRKFQVPKGISKMISSLTGSVNKSYGVYSGDLSSEEYIKNFNWVNTWFNRNKVEFLEHFIALIVPFIIIIILI